MRSTARLICEFAAHGMQCSPRSTPSTACLESSIGDAQVTQSRRNRTQARREGKRGQWNHHRKFHSDGLADRRLVLKPPVAQQGDDRRSGTHTDNRVDHRQNRKRLRAHKPWRPRDAAYPRDRNRIPRRRAFASPALREPEKRRCRCDRRHARRISGRSASMRARRCRSATGRMRCEKPRRRRRVHPGLAS